ncbi:NAD(P)H-dependent amine dehydrogenase family protein [Mycolicibacterium sp. XJ1819]
MTPTKVVQWATGATGSLALRAVIDADDLELVGVRVYEPAKVGRDAGELVGGQPTGVAATDSRDDVLAAGADVVLYMGNAEKHPDECLADVVELLASGADVIATGSSFVDTYAVDAARGRTIDAACRTGGSSFLGVGLFPGFWGEVFAPVLSRLSYRCDEIVVRELLSYAGYPSRDMLVDVMGYGLPPDSQVPFLSDPARAGGAFLGTASVIAKALGANVVSSKSFRETAVTDEDLHVAAGTIGSGTVGAMKLGVRADCGDFAIVVEHVTWMSPEVAPEWTGAEGYEIEFGGAPTLRCNLVLGTRGEDHTEMGCLATAMHAVHAIPVVRNAPPGVLDLADVPGFVGDVHGFSK